MPPYSWSLSGSGFHFNNISGPTSEETESTSETLQLWADNTACGSAIITVIDPCGKKATASVREPNNGQWQIIYMEYCGEIPAGRGMCCGKCSEAVVGGYRYVDCWVSGPHPCIWEGPPKCSKWPYTEDLSDGCCGYVGYYPCFDHQGLYEHYIEEYTCN